MQAPRLTCTSHFTQPSLADGRDLLESVLGRTWDPSVSLDQVSAALPAFVQNCESSDLSQLGTFHLGECLPLSLWQGQPRMNVFNCLEIDPHNPKLVRERHLVVTQLSLLQLDPSKAQPEFGYVTVHSSFAVLAACSSMYAEEDRLSFQWRPSGSTPPAMQLFKFSSPKECLALLEANFANAGYRVTRQQLRPRPTLREEEVSGAALKKVKVSALLTKIKKSEAALEKQVNMETVNSLMILLQRAIEYFSAVGSDDRANDHLIKLRQLLQREDVQKVMEAIDEVRA